MRLAVLFRQDLKYQFRNGIQIIYGILVAIYVVIFRLLPQEARSWMGIFTILTDTGVLAFFFIGAVVMFERNEQLFESLFVSPVKIHEYIISKILSFSVSALVCSLLIYFASAEITAGGATLVLLAVLLSTMLFTTMGIGMAVIAPSLNHYFMYSIVFSMLMVPPVLHYLGLFSCLLVYLSPMAGVLHMLHVSYRGGADAELVLAVASLLPWIVGSFLIVRKKLDQLISLRIGEKSWIRV